MRPGNGRPVSAAPPQVGGAQLPPPIVTVPTPSASPLASPSSRPFPSVTIPSSFGTAPSAPMTSPIPGMGPLPRAPGPARIVSMPPAPSTNALGASGPPQRPIPVPGPPQANKLGASADLSQNPPYSSSNPLASSAPAIPETGSNGVPLRPPPQVRSVPPRMSVPNVMAAPSPSSSSSSASPSPHFGGEEVVNKRATVAARPSVPRASTISSASPSRPLSLRKSKSITNPSFVMQQANRGENPDAFKVTFPLLFLHLLLHLHQLYQHITKTKQKQNKKVHLPDASQTDPDRWRATGESAYRGDLVHSAYQCLQAPRHHTPPHRKEGQTLFGLF